MLIAVRALGSPFLWVVFASGIASAADYFVAPDGLDNGQGTEASPWNLATVFAPSNVVKPGDTIWLGAGVYRGGIKCEFRGAPDRPVTIRSRRGERATIDCRPRDDRDDGLFSLVGSDVTVRDLEITCSDFRRVTQEKGPWPADVHGGGVFLRGDRCRLINCVIHDTASGIGFWAEGEGGEISGCLIYANGWTGPDRGHGHAIYAQNKSGIKRLADNIIFRQFSHGIHCYGSEKASVRGFEIVGNFSLFNGVLQASREPAPDLFVGAGSPIGGILIKDNCLAGGGMKIGYPWGAQGDSARVTGNYVAGWLFVCNMNRLDLQDNEFISPETTVRVELPLGVAKSSFEWKHNRYRRIGKQWGPFSWMEVKQSRDGTFDEWKSHFRMDADSTFEQGPPQGTHIVIRPNPHEPGRGHVFAANWSGTETVDVNLGPVLKDGQRFRVRSALDFFGEPVLEGTFSGEKVSLPMPPKKLPLPVNMKAADVPDWDTRFGVWVVDGLE